MYKQKKREFLPKCMLKKKKTLESRINTAEAEVIVRKRFESFAFFGCEHTKSLSLSFRTKFALFQY